eukprot:GAHX01001933.1.p2 GENE.GAHX01001933.1~~GAHX01001933.1.p2  ORF type:complete len:84 (+),score=17.54 GAHX01001933.1:47-298(+)
MLANHDGRLRRNPLETLQKLQNTLKDNFFITNDIGTKMLISNYVCAIEDIVHRSTTIKDTTPGIKKETLDKLIKSVECFIENL